MAVWQILLFTAALQVANGAAFGNDQLEKDDIINAVNDMGTTWKAGRNFHPSLKEDYGRYLFGTFEKPEGGPELPEYVSETNQNTELPENFDARQKWPHCKVLQTVRDQGPCGSCWAVAATTTFADRLCIATKGKVNVQIATEMLIACNNRNGCEGGFEEEAWDVMTQEGLVTGGDYNSGEGCQPYSLPSCEHHITGKRKNCTFYDNSNMPTPTCNKQCTNKNYTIPADKDFHTAKVAFSIKKLTDVQQQILQYGPVQAGFVVYEDFLSYKSGVYYHTKGKLRGRHSVKVIGWGVEDCTPYWLVANSWISDWGDKGFFKIKRGTNDCGFEESFFAGFANVEY